MLRTTSLALVTIFSVNLACAAVNTDAPVEAFEIAKNSKSAKVAKIISAPEICQEKYTLPEGCWKTIDDKTNQEKSFILINRNSMGEYTGKVLQVIRTDDGRNPETARCENCPGDKQGKLIKGMTVMWGVKKDGNEWTGGEILDPKSGSVYNVKFSLSDSGNELYVRGYMGFSLLGRTQTWKRVK